MHYWLYYTCLLVSVLYAGYNIIYTLLQHFYVLATCALIVRLSINFSLTRENQRIF